MGLENYVGAAVDDFFNVFAYMFRGCLRNADFPETLGERKRQAAPNARLDNKEGGGPPAGLYKVKEWEIPGGFTCLRLDNVFFRGTGELQEDNFFCT